MQNITLWENPFNETDDKYSIWDTKKPVSPDLKPVVSSLGVSAPPTDLQVIRNRQKKLLPQIHKLRDAGLEVLSRIRVQEESGDLLIEKTQRDLNVLVFYRLPDYPDVIRTFGPQSIPDNAVIVPVKNALEPQVLSRLFPMQHASEIEGDRERQKQLIDARKSMGLVESIGIAVGPENANRVIIFPKVLQFISVWIQKIDSPISDIEVYERSDNSNYEGAVRQNILGEKVFVDGTPKIQ